MSNIKIIIRPEKSVAAAILLAFFLGSFGLLYTSFTAGLILTIVALVGALIPRYGMMIFMACWIVGPFIASYKTHKYNRVVFEQLNDMETR
ncbi:MAG: hypothetical protein ABIH77_04420 [Pseudomonadota bacterium]|nr:hypothetical protein [Gammaproteobacteria bacterium]MBU1558274.1 hypothetical protein [Gammaproteobacteria bacterium]MBU1926662.1 hypothetical protein [Gammaproteobacteria bacterium]MBU2545752.1 hypothetical protein [Gammaproteobacteria bacterium]